MLEEYHSIGGMTITEEITLPGFKSDVHAFGYQLANLSPVPHELDLQRHGFELIYPEICLSHIFPNGQYISMYPSIDRTIKSISNTGDANAASRGLVPRPIGGTYLKHAFNVIVYLRESISHPQYKATLIKHQYSKTPKSVLLNTRKANRMLFLDGS